jgi:hypothetical protein
VICVLRPLAYGVARRFILHLVAYSTLSRIGKRAPASLRGGEVNFRRIAIFSGGNVFPALNARANKACCILCYRYADTAFQKG